MPQSEEMTPHTVLITRFSALGDVAMTVPVVYGVCRANTSSRFVMLTKKHAASLFVNPPDNLTVVGVDTVNDYPGVIGMIKLFAQLQRQYHFTAMADLHSVNRTRILWLLCRMRGIRVATITKGRLAKAAMLRRLGKPLPTSAKRYEQVFKRLGLATATITGSIMTDGSTDPALFKAIMPPKANGEKWVGVAPFAAHPTKIFPPQLMREVVRKLTADPSIRVILFGGGETERLTLCRWAQEMPRVVSVAEKRYGLAAELALMASLDCMVAMDSANMHLAALAGVPTVSIWGATHPNMGFTPVGFDPDNALQASMSCRPCSVYGSKECRRGDHACMHAISPRDILEKIKAII